MTMIIVLAWVAVAKIGGMQVLRAQLQVVGNANDQAGAPTANLLAFLPDFHHGFTTGAMWTLPLLTFFMYLGVQWWSAWYPGAEPGGGGYVAQRMFSARDEKNSLAATLWFNLAHYALRPWPWIVTALVAVAVYSPHGGLHPNSNFAASPQQGYVMVLRDFLPPALRGWMVAAFLAAYMSTVGTQLNWGASYLVNDFYKRFLKRDASEKHYVTVSRLATVLLFLLSVIVTMNLQTVEGAWKFLLALGSGTGLVLILRWYWWRINAWSEISAMITSFIVSIAAIALIKPRFADTDLRGDAWVMLVTVAVSTVVWLSVTYLTQPESETVLEAFYRRVRPGGPGWA